MQRVGCFSLITDSPKEALAVESQMKRIARPMYSNPPLHGNVLLFDETCRSALHVMLRRSQVAHPDGSRVSCMAQN